MKTTLVIDHGDGVPVGSPHRVRACEAVAALGAPVTAVLTAAPDDCVAQWSEGSGGSIASVNGVAAIDAGGVRRAWTIEQRDRAATLVTTGATVAFGDIVLLRYGPPPGGDAEPPEVALTLPAEVAEPSVDAHVKASDTVSARGDIGVRYRVDAVVLDWEPYAESRSLALADSEGEHDVCVEARDKAGNVSAPSCARTVYRRRADDGGGGDGAEVMGDSATAATSAPGDAPGPAVEEARESGRRPVLSRTRLRVRRLRTGGVVLSASGSALGAPRSARVLVSIVLQRGRRCYGVRAPNRRTPCHRARWLRARGVAPWRLRSALPRVAAGMRAVVHVRLVTGRATLDEDRRRVLLAVRPV